MAHAQNKLPLQYTELRLHRFRQNTIYASDPAYQARGEFLIGLEQGDSECACPYEDNACQLCRDSWRWSDGSPMTFMAWKRGEPKNARVERCGKLTSEGWVSTRCSLLHRYLCERAGVWIEGIKKAEFSNSFVKSFIFIHHIAL